MPDHRTLRSGNFSFTVVQEDVFSSCCALEHFKLIFRLHHIKKRKLFNLTKDLSGMLVHLYSDGCNWENALLHRHISRVLFWRELTSSRATRHRTKAARTAAIHFPVWLRKLKTSTVGIRKTNHKRAIHDAQLTPVPIYILRQRCATHQNPDSTFNRVPWTCLMSSGECCVDPRLLMEGNRSCRTAAQISWS